MENKEIFHAFFNELEHRLSDTACSAASMDVDCGSAVKASDVRSCDTVGPGCRPRGHCNPNCRRAETLARAEVESARPWPTAFY